MRPFYIVFYGNLKNPFLIRARTCVRPRFIFRKQLSFNVSVMRMCMCIMQVQFSPLRSHILLGYISQHAFHGTLDSWNQILNQHDVQFCRDKGLSSLKRKDSVQFYSESQSDQFNLAFGLTQFPKEIPFVRDSAQVSKIIHHSRFTSHFFKSHTLSISPFQINQIKF